MNGLQIFTDLDKCRALWENMIPRETITDLWEVRSCFNRHFKRPAFFYVLKTEKMEHPALLPLSWIEESSCYGYFPGETWLGKTWLEHNRMPELKTGWLEQLFLQIPGNYHLRYLTGQDSENMFFNTVDEVGYIFCPGDYEYDVETYLHTFPNKRAKQLRKEIAAIESRGVDYRYNVLEDFEHLVRLNLSRFGEQSYFYDHRFRESFRDLMHFLNDQNWLQMTTVLIQGEIAAVDLGCVYNGTYTLLAGATSTDHPGVAKLINFHHLQRSCMERFQKVDFMCGDFSWKKLFHLTARPLYLHSNITASPLYRTGSNREHPPCVTSA